MSAHVLRTSASPQNHIPPLDQTVTDPAKAAALYAALQTLPPFPSGPILCPHETGVAYHLTFSRGQTLMAWAIVDAGGCEGVDLPNGGARLAMGQDHFWTVFANALGVPESDLFPTPAPSGRSAP